jgi:hypothetical protein
MAEAVAMSETMNFGDVRKRAISARNVCLKIPATNGSSFSSGQSINFQFPGNLENSFYDMAKTGFLLTLTNSAAANGGANDAYVPGISGGYGIIDRLTITSAGATLCDIQQYGALVDALLTGETGKSYNMNTLANMAGAGSAGASKVGKVIAEASANPLTIFLPLIACSLANTQPQRLFPAFSAAPIDVRVYLNSTANAYVSAGTPVVTASDCQLVTNMTVVSPEAGRMIDSMVGGVYRMLYTDYRTASAVVTGTGTATNSVATLGFSMSSLDRILWIARSSDSQAQANNSIGSRSTASCSEFQCFVGGKAYPDVPVKLSGNVGIAGYGAEGMAQFLMSSGSLHNFNHESQFGVTIDFAADDDKYALVDADGSTEAKTGSPVYAIGFDSMPSSDNLFSGVTTTGQVVQMKHTYSALPAKAFDLTYYGQFTGQLELDVRGLRTWSVSV